MVSLLHPQTATGRFPLIPLFFFFFFHSIPSNQGNLPSGQHQRTRNRSFGPAFWLLPFSPFVSHRCCQCYIFPSLPLTYRGLIWYHLLPFFLPSSLSLTPFLFSLFLFLRPGSPSYPSIDRTYLSATMPFFSNFRRRSKASFMSNDTRSNESQSNGDVTSGQSSSTLDTSSHSSVTPPSSIKPNGTSSSPNLPALNEAPTNNSSSTSSGGTSMPPQRPGPYVTPSQRNSTFVRDSALRAWLG